MCVAKHCGEKGKWLGISRCVWPYKLYDVCLVEAAEPNDHTSREAGLFGVRFMAKAMGALEI